MIILRLLSKNVRLCETVLLVAVMLTARAQEVYVRDEDPAAIQLRTNGLYWLALSPSVGMEIQTNSGLAFELGYVGAWWNSHARNRFYSNYAFESELRYYLDNKGQHTPFKGHHIGVYGQLVTYDFEFGGRGYQCNDLKKTFAVGASYGYSLPISRHFNVDFTVGVGYFSSKNREYIPFDDGYAATADKKLTFFGPTKLEVSLVWNIKRKNNK